MDLLKERHEGAVKSVFFGALPQGRPTWDEQSVTVLGNASAGHMDCSDSAPYELQRHPAHPCRDPRLSVRGGDAALSSSSPAGAESR
jgi:hypothetical protein